MRNVCSGVGACSAGLDVLRETLFIKSYRLILPRWDVALREEALAVLFGPDLFAVLLA